MALIFKSLFILVCFSQEALAVLSRLPAGNAGPWGEQGTRGFAFEAVFKVTTSTRIFVCICPAKGLTRGWAVEGPSLTGTSPAPTGNPSLTPHTPGRVSRGLNRTAEASGVCRGSSALPWDRAPCADTPGATSIPRKPSLAVPSPSWGRFSPPASHSSDAEASWPRGGLEREFRDFARLHQLSEEPTRPLLAPAAATAWCWRRKHQPREPNSGNCVPRTPSLPGFGASFPFPRTWKIPEQSSPSWLLSSSV